MYTLGVTPTMFCVAEAEGVTWVAGHKRSDGVAPGRVGYKCVEGWLSDEIKLDFQVGEFDLAWNDGYRSSVSRVLYHGGIFYRVFYYNSGTLWADPPDVPTYRWRLSAWRISDCTKLWEVGLPYEGARITAGISGDGAEIVLGGYVYWNGATYSLSVTRFSTADGSILSDSGTYGDPVTLNWSPAEDYFGHGMDSHPLIALEPDAGTAGLQMTLVGLCGPNEERAVGSLAIARGTWTPGAASVTLTVIYEEDQPAWTRSYVEFTRSPQLWPATSGHILAFGAKGNLTGYTGLVALISDSAVITGPSIIDGTISAVRGDNGYFGPQYYDGVFEWSGGDASVTEVIASYAYPFNGAAGLDVVGRVGDGKYYAYRKADLAEGSLL